MTQRRIVQVGAVLLLFVWSGLSTAAPPDPAPVLTATERAALSAYLEELQKAAGSDSIVDLEDPALQGRLQRSSHRHMKSPEVPADVRRHHAHGHVVVAALLERDGTVTKARVVGPSGYSSFDERAQRAVSDARWDEPTTLDGKPVRCFFYTVLYFEVK